MISSLGAAHVTGAIVALALGLFVLFNPKGDGLHRLFGAAYVAAMIVVNVTAFGLYGLTGHLGPFHALALVSLATVAVGTIAALRRRENWLALHYQAMAYSYLGLCAATCAEALVRLKVLGSLAGGTRGGIIVGVAVAVLFALLG